MVDGIIIIVLDVLKLHHGGVDGEVDIGHNDLLQGDSEG